MCGQELRESCNSTSSVWGRGREGFSARTAGSFVGAEETFLRVDAPREYLHTLRSHEQHQCSGHESHQLHLNGPWVGMAVYVQERRLLIIIHRIHASLIHAVPRPQVLPLGSKEYRMSAHRTPYLVMDHKDTAVENVPRHPLSNIQLHSNWNSDQIGTFHPSLICLFCGLWGLRVFGPFSVRWSARRRRKKSASSTFFVRCFFAEKDIPFSLILLRHYGCCEQILI